MLGILLTIHSWTSLWMADMNAWYTTDNSLLNQFVDGRYECLVYYWQFTPEPFCGWQIWMFGILLTTHSSTSLLTAGMNAWYTTDNSLLNHFVDGRYECLVYYWHFTPEPVCWPQIWMLVHYWQFTPEPICFRQIWMLDMLLTIHSWTIFVDGRSIFLVYYRRFTPERFHGQQISLQTTNIDSQPIVPHILALVGCTSSSKTDRKLFSISAPKEGETGPAVV